MRIIVTGGAGFLGSHLCKTLLEQGHTVICIDNLLSGAAKNIAPLRKNKRFKFIKQDITRPLTVAGKIDRIYNLACPASPIMYQKKPIETLLASTAGVHNMLELARKKKARFLQASTSEVYGDPLVHPQHEEYWGNVNPNGVRSCYDEGKRVAESFTENYRQVYHVETRIVRIFNTYGPNMAPDDGRIVSNFIMQALMNKPLTIYGDGSQTRSLCYVDDLIRGIIHVMENDESTPVNLGNPQELTVKQLAEEVLKITGSKSKVIYESLPQDDPKRRLPDITKARKLGWQPSVPRSEGLRKTIEYFRQESKL